MVYRYSWLAGTAALLFVLYQLNGLLRPTVDGPPWQIVVVAALVLGVALTWTVLAYRLPTWVAIVVNAVVATIAVARVAAPETTFALLPTTETLSLLRVQLDQALEIVRIGIEPVIPVSGLVVMVLLLFWVVGFLFAWGLSTGRPYVALLPALVIALQFATMDRQRTSPLRIGIFVAIVAATLLAITLDHREQSAGRMVAVGDYGPPRSRLARSSSVLLGSIVVISVAAASVFGSFVPADGVIEWRSPTGLTGGFYGSSISFNPFISIKQQLVENSGQVVFAATVVGNVPADQVYFSLLTMESYGGGQFSAERPEVVQLEEDEWQAAGHRFAGPVGSIVANVEIKDLAMEWLPSPYAAVEFRAADNIESAVRVRTDDTALHFEGGVTYDRMQYAVQAEIPRPDVAVLATGADGELSPAFQQAAAANELVPEPQQVAVRETPPDVDKYLQLPDDLDDGIAAEARNQTRNLETPFEKAIALESWFHSDAFRYTTDIAPGHGATDLAAWLLEEDSPNHHAGYCENFATAMAVMARTLDIPSRVVLGFTPGTVQSDGVVVVRARNAHAWVELWMPTQGWVRFDPTPRGDGVNPQTYEEIETSLGFPLTDYLDVPDPEPVNEPFLPPNLSNFEDLPPGFAPVGGGDTAPDTGFQLPGWMTNIVPWLAAVLLLFGAIPLLKWWRSRRRMRRLRSGDISAAWEEIISRLDDLGTPPSPADTPAEVASRVDPHMAPLASVYARSVYGATSTLPDTYVTTATTSLEQTERALAARHTRMQRLRASYRLRSLVPRRWRGNGRR